MHQALYRKWRPKVFDSVCGQEHITSVLRYEVSNNTYSHAYLFCGSRGTGKTTCAKLLAKAVNCLNPINGNPCGKCEACLAIENETTTDVVEMDAASNTGVDYIRDIREAVMYAPSMLKNRVYIIDEVHMLTQSAFNALLKTLEEPPSRVVFILATTEQQKIPATILSRCQKFEFRRIASDIIADRLIYIAKEENISLTPDAAKLIARMSAGGMRDAISLLELCAGDGKEITIDAVKSVTGAPGREQAAKTVNAVLNKDYDGLFSIINEIVSSSKEITVFFQELLGFYRDMLVFKTTKNPKTYLDLTDDESVLISSLAEKFKLPALLSQCASVESAFANMQKNGASKRLCAEMALIRMCDEKLNTVPENIIARLSDLEEKIAIIMNSDFKPSEIKSTSKTDTMFKKDFAPKKEETKTILPEEPAKKVREGIKPALWWIEAAKKVAETNPSVYPFLKQSKAFEHDGKIKINVNGQIGITLLDTMETRNLLASVASVSAGKRISPADFEFVCSSEQMSDESDPLDEFDE